MINLKDPRINLYSELDKYDSIKNSIYYNIIKDKKVKELTDNELKDFKSFILSLKKNEIIIILTIIIDDSYNYCSEDDENNKSIYNFLTDKNFEKYISLIYSQFH